MNAAHIRAAVAAVLLKLRNDLEWTAPEAAGMRYAQAVDGIVHELTKPRPKRGGQRRRMDRVKLRRLKAAT